jgi:hypothetical protein
MILPLIGIALTVPSMGLSSPHGRTRAVRVLREHRLKSPDGADLIDALIRHMEASCLARS